MSATDHNLEVLKTKTGGLPGATALIQVKASLAFTISHQDYWDATRRTRGDLSGTSALIEILLAHYTSPAVALTAAMGRAVTSGRLDPAVVLIDARRDNTQVAPDLPIGELARYNRDSIAIATNLPVGEWGAVFPDLRLVAVDRVTYNADIRETGTQSYRLRTSKTPAGCICSG